MALALAAYLGCAAPQTGDLLTLTPGLTPEVSLEQVPFHPQEHDQCGPAALAMVLNELTINSLKHGALGQDGGTVELSWRSIDEGDGPRTTIEWIEQGGPPVEPPERVGMGLELINGLMKTELNGRARLEFPPDGAHHQLELDVTA